MSEKTNYFQWERIPHFARLKTPNYIHHNARLQAHREAHRSVNGDFPTHHSNVLLHSLMGVAKPSTIEAPTSGMESK